MFKIMQKGVNRLDIELSGKLDAEEMKIALDELVSKSKNAAIGIEFSRLPSMFGLMKKFDRAAVLTDKTWLKKVSELEGALYPGLEIKAFNIHQKAEAEAWLSS